MQAYDVAIAGGGLVGATLACGLGSSGLRVAVIEPNPDLVAGEFGADGRASAIALGSSHIWQAVGVWEAIAATSATPIHTVRMSDGDFPWTVDLRGADIGCAAVGYIVENAVSLRELWRSLRRHPNIEVIPARVQGWAAGADVAHLTLQQGTSTTELTARLVVAADGGHSPLRQMAGIGVRERFYDQTCLVATVRLGTPHGNVAHERFQPSGPFAVLPMGEDRACLVWTVKNTELAEVLALEGDALRSTLRARFGDKLGAAAADLALDRPLATVGRYTPRWRHAHSYVGPRLALAGDAAHTTHPLAGQGVNLGLRDAAALAETILAAAAAGEDWGSAAVLRRYQRRRWWDNLGVISLTHLANRMFSNEIWPLTWISTVGDVGGGLVPVQTFVYAFVGGVDGAPSPAATGAEDRGHALGFGPFALSFCAPSPRFLGLPKEGEGVGAGFDFAQPTLGHRGDGGRRCRCARCLWCQQSLAQNLGLEAIACQFFQTGTQGRHGNLLQHLPRKAVHQQLDGADVIQPAAAQVKQLLGIQLAHGGAMGTFDIVGQNFQLGLGMNPRCVAEQQTPTQLGGIGLLGPFPHHNFAVEDASAATAGRAFVPLTAAAVGVIQGQGGVGIGQAIAPHQRQTPQMGFGGFPRRPHPQVVPGNFAPRAIAC
ncbi:MAG: UbiH/UbiF/VisC/COQ6 family ubiquinone biosynthesis hydroxylase [Oscillatoriales cyanobacterium SM2_1_8]|nr:UbiH/UbiF/VisC/COQ6 family ubiquinone biosynthesis hydroxylase [Oscillatoriales cyanobacterium SM2_1_8]